MRDISSIIDEDGDEIPPKIVLEHVRAHDKKMRRGREGWAMAKAAYMTEYWSHLRGNPASPHSGKTSDIDIEVNRLWGMLASYLSALYPRAARAVVSNDPTGTGDSSKAELAVNHWLETRRIHHRITSALRQSLLYPGSGAKIGYHPGRGSALDRVWIRIIPWWEMLLDSDVGDPEDERFRGHIYYRPKHEVEEEYGLENLTGVAREDFLAGRHSDTTQKNRSKYNEGAESDNTSFVRVLELCNLKDTVRDEADQSVEYQGRMEIYVLGQGAVSNKPVFLGPLPFARADGEPMAHIVPLIFNHEPEFPLRGVAHSARLMPQIRELNSYRSFMAMATRKDTRQYITRKGTFSAEELTGLTEGQDGLVLEISSDFERALDDAIRPIMNGPITSSLQNYIALVENDLDRVIGTSPQSRGTITKATAFEVQTVQQYTESEYGMHGLIKDEWLAELIRVVLRALIASMQDLGDSAGAYEDEDELKLGEVGAEIDEDNEVTDEEAVEEPGEETIKASEGEEGEEFEESESEEPKRKPSKEQAKAKMIDMVGEMSGMQTSMRDDDLVPDLGYDFTGDTSADLRYQSIVLRDRNESVDIHPVDLDAEFEVNFVESGRTPVNDSAMQQNLIGLMEPYVQLWQASQQPDAMGTLARNYLKVIAERFDLPKDLHPEELEIQTQERMERAAEESGQPVGAEAAPQPAPPGTGVPGPSGDQPPQAPVGPPVSAPGAPPAPGPPMAPAAGIVAPEGAGLPPGEAPPAQEDLTSVLQQVLSMPPEEALEVLETLFASNPEMLNTLAQVRQLPPEEQVEAIRAIVEGVLSAGV